MDLHQIPGRLALFYIIMCLYHYAAMKEACLLPGGSRFVEAFCLSLCKRGLLAIKYSSSFQVRLQRKGEEIKRRFEVLYLDNSIRIAQYLTQDQTDPAYLVFKRVQDSSKPGAQRASTERPEVKALPVSS